MAQITTSASLSHKELKDVLLSILTDLTAIKTAVDSQKMLADANKTAINAIIVAAATNIGAVAAVTKVSAASPTAVGTLATTS